MNTSSNASRERCRVVSSNLECWISDIRKVELTFHAARYSEKSQSMSSAVLAISPTHGGPK